MLLSRRKTNATKNSARHSHEQFVSSAADSRIQVSGFSVQYLFRGMVLTQTAVLARLTVLRQVPEGEDR